jgi:hypothetical protein
MRCCAAESRWGPVGICTERSAQPGAHARGECPDPTIHPTNRRMSSSVLVVSILRSRNDRTLISHNGVSCSGASRRATIFRPNRATSAAPAGSRGRRRELRVAVRRPGGRQWAESVSGRARSVVSDSMRAVVLDGRSRVDPPYLSGTRRTGLVLIAVRLTVGCGDAASKDPQNRASHRTGESRWPRIHRSAFCWKRSAACLV